MVGPPSPAQGGQRFESGPADGQPPAAPEAAAATPAQGPPSGNATIPSPGCAKREEWHGPCQIWSGKPHHRYLAINGMPAYDGIGGSLTRAGWLLGCAMSFDLEPVFSGPLLATHGQGDVGDWAGLTHNPLLTIQDPKAFKKATNQSVPLTERHMGSSWFRKHENQTSVVYTPDTIKTSKSSWGVKISPPNSDPRVCKYAHQAMRNIYWSVPQNRGRCRCLLPEDYHTPPVLPEDHDTPPEPVVDVSVSTSRNRQDRKRPWVIAVHVRRGDVFTHFHGKRTLPHAYFQATVTAVLRAIAVVDPEAHVSVLVFSEGPETLAGLQIIDENKEPVTWDVQHESCSDIGIHCSQV